MAVPPVSAFVPEGTELPRCGAFAVRVERDGDGVRVTMRDHTGWWLIAHCEPAEIAGRRGYSGVARLQETPEFLRLPGEDAMREPEGGTKPRGIGPKAAG